MRALKVVSIGDEMGVILPQDILAKLKCAAGDTLLAVETKDGAFLSLAVGTSNSLQVARHVMEKRRSVLRDLAK